MHMAQVVNNPVGPLGQFCPCKAVNRKQFSPFSSWYRRTPYHPRFTANRSFSCVNTLHLNSTQLHSAHSTSLYLELLSKMLHETPVKVDPTKTGVKGLGFYLNLSLVEGAQGHLETGVAQVHKHHVARGFPLGR